MLASEMVRCGNCDEIIWTDFELTEEHLEFKGKIHQVDCRFCKNTSDIKVRLHVQAGPIFLGSDSELV